jgi:hypothetical protein
LSVDAVDSAPPPPGAFDRPADRASDADFAGSAASVELPIVIGPGGIVSIAGRIAGHPVELIIDSGAEGSVLNAAHLGDLALAGKGVFAVGAGGGDTVASYVEHVTFELPGVTLRDQSVAAIDFGQLEDLTDHRIDGILGYDFLSRFVVELDYPRQRIRLHDPARYRHGDAGAIPITLEGSTPWIDASISVPGRPPITGHFTVDTGCACHVAMTTPFTDTNHLLDAVHTAKLGDYAGAGGMTETVSGEIPALHIGGVTIDRPLATFSRDHKGATADPDSAGLIGAEVFRRFVLVLDYARGRMWLDPPG